MRYPRDIVFMERVADMLMRAVIFLGVLLLALTVAEAALAQSVASSAPPPDTVVVVPWGGWLTGLLQFCMELAGTLLLGVLTFAATKLPASIQAYVTKQRIAQVEQLLERGLGYAVSQIEEAVKGKTLSIDVKNDLVEEAAQYVIDHAPTWLIDWMGGGQAIAEKIRARLPTSPAVQVASGKTPVVVNVAPGADIDPHFGVPTVTSGL